MLKNTLLSLFFCLFSIGALSAQAQTRQPGNLPAKNYLDYYHAVAVAEDAVVNGGYEEAIQQYRKTFREYPYNNPIDCYIAAQVAAYTGDTASCIHFLYKGLRFGLPVQTITGNPHLVSCFQKTDQHTVDSCWRLYQESIDHKARATMLSLIKRDQFLVHSLPPGEHIYDYAPAGSQLKDKYRPVWDSLIHELILLIRTSGFPAQKVIGTQTGEDSLFRTGPNAVFAYPIFIHHSNAWNQVHELLWPELQQGNITPQMYGCIYESSNGNRDYENEVVYLAIRPCQEKKCRKLLQERLPEINAARWKIGLGSYETMEKKFESKRLYYKWCRKASGSKEPVFDFQCDLSFQR